MELFKLFGTIAITNADANEAIDDTTDKAEQSENKISSAFKKVGAAVATYFAVDKIKDFGLNCINAASDAQAASSQFSQVFGDMEKDASKSLKGIADDTGIQVNRMKGSYTQIAAFAKTTGMDTESSLGLANRAMVAVADSAAFYDRSLEETTESLQSFLKGNYENDSALGLSCTETTRNAAANKLYGKSFNDLDEAQKQLTLLQMVEDANAASGALGQAARESDTWTNQTGNLQQAWTDFQAALGNNVLPLAVEVVKRMASAVQSVSEKIPAMVQWFEKYKGVIAAVATAIGIVTAAVRLQNAVQAIKAAMNAAETTSLAGLIAAKWADAAATMAALAPYILIVAAIAAVIAIVVLLVKHWDTVKEKCIELWDKLKEVWENIKNTISEKVEAIKTALSEKWNAIVAFLSQILEGIKTTFSNIWNAIKTTVTTVVNAIKTVITTVWNAIKSTVSTVMNAIQTTVSSIWNSIKSTVSSVVNAIKSVISSVFNAVKPTVSSILNSIKSVFSSVWNSIKSTVSNVINGVKSTISSGLNAAKTTVSSVLEGIKSKFSSIFDGAKNIVKNAIDRIKGFFNFSWSLPHLKLPHFSVSGKFSLDPPSVPHFGIEWYKKAMDDGMIMDQPTIFGYNPKSGRFLGGGEAGSETVVGTENLMTMIQNAVSSGDDNTVTTLLAQILAVLQRIDRRLYDTIVKALENMRFEIADRQFARLVRRV